MTTTEIREKVATAKNKLLYTHLFSAVVGSFLAATLVYFALQEYNLSYITHWYVIMIGLSIIRLLLLAHYRLYYQHSPTVPVWHIQLFIVSALANAMNWGVLGSFLMTSEPLIQLLNLAMILGISAGASQSLVSNKKISAFYLSLTMTPITIWLFFQDSSVYTYIGSGTTILFIIFITISRHGNRTLTTALTLQFENALKNEQLNQALTHLKETQEALIIEEKMSSVGMLATGIAHEIKNPLNFINNFSEASEQQLLETIEIIKKEKSSLNLSFYSSLEECMMDLSENYKRINFYGKRANDIINTLLLHSEKLDFSECIINLSSLIEPDITLALNSFKLKNPNFEVVIQKYYDPKIQTITAPGQAIARALIYLFDNAFYAMNQKLKTIDYTPTLSIYLQRESNTIVITIHDNGIGIPHEHLHKIFEPFYTTKPTGKGNTGLGLSNSYDIITTQCKGTLTVQSEEGVYTEFTIRLPIT